MKLWKGDSIHGKPPYVSLISWLAILAFSALSLGPLFLGLKLLSSVTGISPIFAPFYWGSHPAQAGALAFSISMAATAAILTICFGLPIAWVLGRYSWKRGRLLRALLALPFVTPAIVAAMGFLALIDKSGPLVKLGIDLRGESGFIGWLNENVGASIGIEHLGHWLALEMALVWFNISLAIRFLEPTIANMDPNREAQLKLLPAGQSKISVFREVWLPTLWPGIAATAGLTFAFSFTSFALVRWLTPYSNSLETLMGTYGRSAGIENYAIDSSLLVLSASLIQFIIVGSTLVLVAWMQKKSHVIHHQVSEKHARKTTGKPTMAARVLIFASLVYSLTPLVVPIISSFRLQRRFIASNGQTEVEYYWSSEAWKIAWQGDLSASGAGEALIHGLGYAAFTLFVALPICLIISSKIVELERAGRRWTAFFVDATTMIPLAVSGAMVGLGVLLGILRWLPQMFSWYWLPALAHVMLVMPFLTRMLLPTIRSLDPALEENARLLKMGYFARLYHIKLPSLSSSIVVASALALAFSLGEFGASWVLMRSGSWDTLSILVDSIMSRPAYFPMVRPVAMACASILLFVTLALFLLAEQFRSQTDVQGM